MGKTYSGLRDSHLGKGWPTMLQLSAQGFPYLGVECVLHTVYYLKYPPSVEYVSYVNYISHLVLSVQRSSVPFASLLSSPHQELATPVSQELEHSAP